MLRSLWTAASGMMAQQQNVDVISNNLANVNTAGYKTMRAEFSDLLYQTIKDPGASTGEGVQNPVGVQLGHGSKLVATYRIFTVGNLQPTERPLDVAIEGDGFFQIQQLDGTIAYTRDGSFKVGADGRLVTSEGLSLEPEITLPDNVQHISIGQDGTVSVLVTGESTPQDVGQITIAKFINPAGLRAMGHNLFTQSPSSGEPVVVDPGSEGTGTLSQGYIEMSNVSIVDEMVKMITAQRAYEINSKSIQTSDDMLGLANNLKR